MATSPKEYWDKARSVETTPDELAPLASSRYEFVVAAVAANVNTPAAVLATLVRSPDQNVICAIAANPSTPESTLIELASSGRPEALPELASNPSASEVVLRLIADRLRASRARSGFAGIDVRAIVVLSRHPRAPVASVIELLAHDRATRRLRKMVARETGHGAVVAHLADDRSEVVRRTARARNFGTAG